MEKLPPPLQYTKGSEDYGISFMSERILFNGNTRRRPLKLTLQNYASCFVSVLYFKIEKVKLDIIAVFTYGS